MISDDLDVQVGVDESGDDDFAGDVDLDIAAIVGLRADDAVVADRDVALLEFAGDEIEDAPALQHQIGAEPASPLGDGAGEKGGDVVHRLEPPKSADRGDVLRLGPSSQGRRHVPAGFSTAEM